MSVPSSQRGATALKAGGIGGGGRRAERQTTVSVKDLISGEAVEELQRENEEEEEREKEKRSAEEAENLRVLIVGLGNPGKEYERTRHNAGFLFVDRLAETVGVNLTYRDALQGSLGGTSVKWRKRQTDVAFLKPMTLMNLSGDSVKKACAHFGIPPENVLVVCDELEMAAGDATVKVAGAPGSHNGLKSVAHSLDSRDFPRLLLGIGRPPPKASVSDWVLNELPPRDMASLALAIEVGCEVCKRWVKDGDSTRAQKMLARKLEEKGLKSDGREGRRSNSRRGGRDSQARPQRGPSLRNSPKIRTDQERTSRDEA
uniref:peptidyl-tRNA hydrolase n=1 Tax=Chromera velia CCMP2878 TaxID=1169474 RepID=A0A0G4HP16_9ALVE|eukprot:Cvel_29788.t1-p1 / transcript=Cvel_29788.t1 / gene=Cvel_29788 / organism=Chromera_velia_CCMP2878 / gene_product=Peptidyl-tRNA hydrolase, putative / transcript_product=Peptidyl-tRNA hydrolase, putative / location=Cvel_scaffold4142:2313-7527(+) / protein_length=314 / sequence_SO=supercontig / SO=protein_coding / is_pseudo=false